MKKIIIFDFNGVFVNDFTARGADVFCNNFKLDYKIFQKVVRELALGLDRGTVSERDFIKTLIKRGDLSASIKDIRLYFIAQEKIHIKRREAVYRLHSKLNKKYQTVLASNISAGLSNRLREYGHYPSFNRVFFSYKIGYIKTDKKYWPYVLKHLKADPKDIVFIDDSLVNVIAAKKYGIQAIKFVNVKLLKKKLINLHLLTSVNF